MIEHPRKTITIKPPVGATSNVSNEHWGFPGSEQANQPAAAGSMGTILPPGQHAIPNIHKHTNPPFLQTPT